MIILRSIILRSIITRGSLKKTFLMLHFKEDIPYKNSFLFKMFLKKNPDAFPQKISEIFTSFPGLSLLLNSKMFVAIGTSENSCALFEVYKVTPASNLTITRLCNYDQTVKNSTETKNIWERRKNLKGVNFRVGVMATNSLISTDNKVPGDIFLKKFLGKFVNFS